MTRRPIRSDGRTARAAVTREKLLTATRALMVSGMFRPTAVEIVHADGFSERSIRQHFPTLEALYAEAIDSETAHAMVSLLPVDDERELALVLALGRAPARAS